MIDEIRLFAAFGFVDQMSIPELREVEKRIAIRRATLGSDTLKSFRLIRFPRAGDMTLRSLFLGFKRDLPGGGEAVDLPVIFTNGDRILEFKTAGVMTPPDHLSGPQTMTVKIELIAQAPEEDHPLGLV